MERPAAAAPGRTIQCDRTRCFRIVRTYCTFLHSEPDSAMPLSRTDLADYSYFVAIARHRSFRRAGLDVGISASALSHALKGLETRVGVRLLNRTNRSVTLTAAGEELLEAISGPFSEIEQAADRLNRYRDTPAGRIRINVPVEAASLVIGPVLAPFVDRYPDVELDIAVSNHLVDVTEGGFDAGIRYGGTVPMDMVAQRLSADITWVVAGSPAYFARYGEPSHPDDLAEHRCLRFRIGDDSIYEWEFERDGEEVSVPVPGSLLFDDSRAILAALVGGAGLMYAPAPLIASLVENGAVRIVMADWASPGPGFYVYYSSRRQVPTGLRLLIDLVRELRPLGL